MIKLLLSVFAYLSTSTCVDHKSSPLRETVKSSGDYQMIRKLYTVSCTVHTIRYAEAQASMACDQHGKKGPAVIVETTSYGIHARRLYVIRTFIE